MLETTRKDNGTIVAKPAASSGDVEDEGKSSARSGSGTKLEEFDSFPARSALVDGGFATLSGVRAATDEELVALDGIGDATLEEIRNAQQ